MTNEACFPPAVSRRTLPSILPTKPGYTGACPLPRLPARTGDAPAISAARATAIAIFVLPCTAPPPSIEFFRRLGRLAVCHKGPVRVDDAPERPLGGRSGLRSRLAPRLPEVRSGTRVGRVRDLEVRVVQRGRVTGELVGPGGAVLDADRRRGAVVEV